MGEVFKPQSVIELYNRIDLQDVVASYYPQKDPDNSDKIIPPPIRDTGSGTTACHCPICINPQEYESAKDVPTPLELNLISNLYHCTNCHHGGDAVNFVMVKENIAYEDALKTLAEKEGVTLPTEDSVYHTLTDADILTLAKDYFKLHVNNIKPYLFSRGIETETIDRFEVGYWPRSSGMISYIESQTGYIPGNIRRLLFKQNLLRLEPEHRKSLTNKDGKIYEEEIDFDDTYFFLNTFQGRIMFPIKSTQGSVVGFGARWLGPDGMTDKPPKGVPKYLNSTEREPVLGQRTLYKKSNVLYGLHEGIKDIRRTKRASAVEGYTDVLAMYQANMNLPEEEREMPVSPSGTAFSPKQAQLLSRHNVERLRFVFDGDAPGMDGVTRSLQSVMWANIPSKITLLPDGDDPHSFLLRNKFDFSQIESLKEYTSLDVFVGKAISKLLLKKPELSEQEAKESWGPEDRLLLQMRL